MTPPINTSFKHLQLPRSPLNKQDTNIVTPPKELSNNQELNIVTPNKPLSESKNLWLFKGYCDELTPSQIKTFNDTTNIKYINPQP